MVTDRQVRRLLEMYNKYKYLYQAADAAGISRKTARKYLKSGRLPSQCKVEHTWPTRQDPFTDDWAFVVQMLEDTQATLEAKTIFEYLQRAYPGKYHNGQLRTLQRRIKAWRALYYYDCPTAIRTSVLSFCAVLFELAGWSDMFF